MVIPRNDTKHVWFSTKVMITALSRYVHNISKLLCEGRFVLALHSQHIQTRNDVLFNVQIRIQAKLLALERKTEDEKELRRNS